MCVHINLQVIFRQVQSSLNVPILYINLMYYLRMFYVSLLDNCSMYMFFSLHVSVIVRRANSKMLICETNHCMVSSGRPRWSGGWPDGRRRAWPAMTGRINSHGVLKATFGGRSGLSTGGEGSSGLLSVPCCAEGTYSMRIPCSATRGIYVTTLSFLLRKL